MSVPSRSLEANSGVNLLFQRPTFQAVPLLIALHAEGKLPGSVDRAQEQFPQEVFWVLLELEGVKSSFLRLCLSSPFPLTMKDRFIRAPDVGKLRDGQN